MAKAVAARMAGDDYQGRWFWFQACRLFHPKSPVSRVGYEIDTHKAFDDVAVEYSLPIPDGRGGYVVADYFQVKFHVDHAGAFTWRDLIDPAFINASTHSLLRRIRDAYIQSLHTDRPSRFYIVSPWPIDPADQLALLVSNQNEAIRLDKLFDGTGSRSAMGQVRQAWCKHLDISESDLRDTLGSLRLRVSQMSMAALAEVVNGQLAGAGLVPVASQQISNPYDELIRKLHQQGQSFFTRSEMETICRAEGLWRGIAIAPSPPKAIGIRAFMRWAESLDDEVDALLCLTQHFDNRAIKAPASWNSTLLPTLQGFLSKELKRGVECHLHLDAHASIACAAGFCLPTKSGLAALPVQSIPGAGKVVWRPSTEYRLQDGRAWAVKEIKCKPDGTDLFVGIGVTHDVLPDVRTFAANSGSPAKCILYLAVQPAPGGDAITDAAHAHALVQSAIQAIRAIKVTQAIEGKVHLFASAPNAFMFWLGQCLQAVGTTVLYEYNFDRKALGDYTPSFELAS